MSVNLGNKNDSPVDDPTQVSSAIALLKGLLKLFRSFTIWEFGQQVIGSSAEEVWPADTASIVVRTIVNTHASDTLYIGTDATLTTGNGFPLPAGRSKAWTHKQAIWALRGSTNDITIGKDREAF